MLRIPLGECVERKSFSAYSVSTLLSDLPLRFIAPGFAGPQRICRSRQSAQHWRLPRRPAGEGKPAQYCSIRHTNPFLNVPEAWIDRLPFASRQRFTSLQTPTRSPDRNRYFRFRSARFETCPGDCNNETARSGTSQISQPLLVPIGTGRAAPPTAARLSSV
jgi:hypothetical protein